MRLAVIPARGGSKRIPRKNIKPFCGKPMIAWSIAAAQASGCFDRIIVSTDDSEIAELAQEFGADVPFARPAHLADDHAETIPVIRHAIEWCAENTTRPELVCCIYATAPFLQPADLVRGLHALIESECDYAFSVTDFASPIQRALRIRQDGRVEMLQPDNFHRRSQDLEATFHDAGQFYWGTPNAWIAERPIFSSNTVPIVLPIWRALDIDSDDDWTRAEYIFNAMKSAEPV